MGSDLPEGEVIGEVPVEIANRVTAKGMLSRIHSVDYMRMGATVTICMIELDNGYSVRGESACVDPANFDEEVGRNIAYDDAFRKLWPLFGFMLCEDRFREDEI